MKKIAAASLAGAVIISFSAYANDTANITQERFQQKSNGFNGTAQTMQTISKQPLINNKQNVLQSDPQYSFSHRGN